MFERLQLGCPSMFTPAANFSNIADGELYVGSVFHKAFVDVDEKGTEAAAATGNKIYVLCLVFDLVFLKNEETKNIQY